MSAASREASVAPGQDLRQDVVRADVDGPFGILRRLEERYVQPHVGLGDAGPSPGPRVRRASLFNAWQRRVEVDEPEIGPVRFRDGGELPAVVTFEQQVVIDQGFSAGQDRAYFPAGGVPEE